ncbi:CBO0543 family protein [uncultured Clostridium sp.]|uniref:CBO0543 family protein n=1 Tax=uncultured Clostridium sp. TaxID=59620 RepID=UPI00345BF3FB
MYLIFLSVVSIAICYKLGDWRNWRKYYSTILFFILTSVIFSILTYNHPLWSYKPVIINHTFTDLFVCITIYSSTIMMFIPHLPRKTTKKIIHVSFYVAVYSIAESIAIKFGYFNHFNGWNIWYTLIFDYIMFLVLILHYKKPIYACILVLIGYNIIFLIMKVPYSIIR